VKEVYIVKFAREREGCKSSEKQRRPARKNCCLDCFAPTTSSHFVILLSETHLIIRRTTNTHLAATLASFLDSHRCRPRNSPSRWRLAR
jgi:hypothetical protein